MTIVISWFRLNSLSANPGKFQIMFLGVRDNKTFCLEIDNNVVIGKKKLC